MIDKQLLRPPSGPPVVTRFAPSPTGFLHLGHAYAALFAHRTAQFGAGRFLLRIEDIDTGRCRTAFEDAIYEDLAWLGLTWEQPVRRQSDWWSDYKTHLDRLHAMELLYPCFCTRADIKAEIEAAGGAPHLSPGQTTLGPTESGPDGPIYPGTCRKLTDRERKARTEAGAPFALRLNMARAVEMVGQLNWTDLGKGTVLATPEIFGDVVLARKDAPTSYHLSVTVDDHLQGVTLVTRGNDLFLATHVHRLLQALLGFDSPTYHHHGLLTSPNGQRLAKRNKAETLRALRSNGQRPIDVRRLIGFEEPSQQGD